MEKTSTIKANGIKIYITGSNISYYMARAILIQKGIECEKFTLIHSFKDFPHIQEKTFYMNTNM